MMRAVLQATQGHRGNSGASGVTGAQGETGLSDAQGSTGLSGNTGVLDSHVATVEPLRLVASALTDKTAQGETGSSVASQWEPAGVTGGQGETGLSGPHGIHGVCLKAPQVCL